MTKKMNWMNALAVACCLSIATAGCAKKEEPKPEAPYAPAEDTEKAAEPDTYSSAAAQAIANLELGPDRASAGMVSFTPEGDGVKIVAHIVGAPPGTHGLHVHEIGDCSSDDFKSAGGHFNPTDAPHGGPEDAERHAGDLGNIVIGEDGSAHLELVSDMLSLGEDDNSVMGRAVILHEKADDLVSQPTGAAGARLACGVVVPKTGV